MMFSVIVAYLDEDDGEIGLYVNYWPDYHHAKQEMEELLREYPPPDVGPGTLGELVRDLRGWNPKQGSYSLVLPGRTFEIRKVHEE